MTVDGSPIDLDDIHIPQETAAKLDQLIRGVKDGKFDKVVKKVQFNSKLKGEFNEPQYVSNLLRRIDHLEEEKHDMKNQIGDLVANNSRQRAEIDTLESEMATVAKAIQYLMTPDPLGSNYELGQIESFISAKGARKF